MASKRGCWFWGCTITAILAVLIVGVIVMVTWALYEKGKSFTSAKPEVVTVYQATPEEYNAAKAKFKKLRQALDNKEACSVSLTAEDINTMIATEPDLKELSGKVFVTIEDDLLNLKGSVPLKNVLPIYQDRFINGDFSFSVAMGSDGRVSLILTDAKVNGKPLPNEFTKEFKKKSLLDDFYDDPRNADKLKRIKDLQVSNNKLLIELKAEGEDNGKKKNNTETE